MNQKQQQLYQFIIANQQHGSFEAFNAVKQHLDGMNVLDLFDVFNRLLETQKPEQIIEYVDRVIHVFAPTLKNKMVELPKDSILEHLNNENKAFLDKLKAIQELLKQPVKPTCATCLPLFQECATFDVHHQKIQNVIMPLLEKAEPKTVGLKILWSYQDKTKKTLKHLIQLCQKHDTLTNEINQLIGSYFFLAFGLAQKEELILYQIAVQSLPSQQLLKARILCQEFDSCFIDPLPVLSAEIPIESNNFFNSETGSLSLEQLKSILNALPIDITFIDQDDKVVFFNRPVQRIFARSAAVIGRDVRNCHPAHSVDTVNEILTAFKNKTQKEADFWIDMKGQFLYIRYVALYNERKHYIGCLEISQEVSKIRSLANEKRLLSWNQPND